MNKQEIYKIVHPYCGNEYAEKVAQEIFDATYPVGGHHDHMCPCGRDWETKKHIAKRLYVEYLTWIGPTGKGFRMGVTFPKYLERRE